MDADTVVSIGRQAMEVTILLAAPILLASLAVGLIIAMFQAATQINEMTLSFVPKLMVVALADFLVGWLKRRTGTSGPVEAEAPSGFEVPFEVQVPPEPVVVVRPAPPVQVSRASSTPPRGKSSVQGSQRGVRQVTARVARPAVAPLIGSRAELRRAIVLRELLGPPKGLE